MSRKRDADPNEVTESYRGSSRFTVHLVPRPSGQSHMPIQHGYSRGRLYTAITQNEHMQDVSLERIGGPPHFSRDYKMLPDNNALAGIGPKVLTEGCRDMRHRHLPPHLYGWPHKDALLGYHVDPVAVFHRPHGQNTLPDAVVNLAVLGLITPVIGHHRPNKHVM